MMHTKMSITLLTALAPVIAQAHPGHGDSQLMSSMPSEYLELLMAFFALALLLKTSLAAPLRNKLAQHGLDG